MLTAQANTTAKSIQVTMSDFKKNRDDVALWVFGTFRRVLQRSNRQQQRPMKASLHPPAFNLWKIPT